ncbi:hypothetical protein CEXT_165081 [Caerostris extrusa]|uniref:Uncharacterized protein n=1 Tax=Caerostris extrusa TaxID=172846 RepID=A0AAV4P485_CAEEX|nr:hypothetical protein CEXT_165081 [Caerostris extrusa]
MKRGVDGHTGDAWESPNESDSASESEQKGCSGCEHPPLSLDPLPARPRPRTLSQEHLPTRCTLLCSCSNIWLIVNVLRQKEQKKNSLCSILYSWVQYSVGIKICSRVRQMLAGGKHFVE